MSLYTDDLERITTREQQGLHPKPIEDAELVEELVAQIRDTAHEHHAGSLQFFITNTLPGTTSAAKAKARLLKSIILGDAVVAEIPPTFAFELLSPGSDAHSRSDRELHGQSLFEHDKAAQKVLLDLKTQHPDKRVMMVSDKGTMGVGSSRMSGVNNVALWTGIQGSPYVPFVNLGPVGGGTNGISPIFLTTVGVTGGVGIDRKSWVKKVDASGQPVLDDNGEPVLERRFSIDPGSVLTIHTQTKELTHEADAVERCDLSSAIIPQKLEFIRAKGSYAEVFGKKLQTTAASILGIGAPQVYATSKEIRHEGQGLTAVEEIFNQNAVGTTPGKVLHAGSDVRVKVHIVGSQDTTGLMTSQELEMMAATVISPTVVDGSYPSGRHTASAWNAKARRNTPKLMGFMNTFGRITARDPKGVYDPVTDGIHKVLNDLMIDEWAVIIGGDSHTRMSKGVAFGADSGTVALALAAGEATMPIPQSVKVTFKGTLKDHMDFRDVVHATQAQMLKAFGGDNVFQGKIIEVQLGTLLSDQAFAFADWTAEMKAKASSCISEPDTLVESLEIAEGRIQILIDRGMDNDKQVLKGLIAKAQERIAQIHSGAKSPLMPDANAKYSSELVVDLDPIVEPMIADPDVTHDDVSKRYTHVTIRPISFYGGKKPVDLGFVGSCMVHKGDMKIISQMLRNNKKMNGTVEFKAPLVVAPPTYNIVNELKEEGDWEMLSKYAGFAFDDSAPKTEVSTILGRTPSIEGYIAAVDGIKLTHDAPPTR